eukprot:superscaffoldBa00001651_g11456
MNTIIQCIVLLACASICTSRVIMTSCQCVKTNKTVDLSRIADIKVYNPRPHCSKQEIIAVLRQGAGFTSRCLDPNEELVQAIVKTVKLQKMQQAAKMNSLSPKKTTK